MYTVCLKGNSSFIVIHINNYNHLSHELSIKFLLRTPAKYPIKPLRVMHRKHIVVYGSSVLKPQIRKLLIKWHIFFVTSRTKKIISILNRCKIYTDLWVLKCAPVGKRLAYALLLYSLNWWEKNHFLPFSAAKRTYSPHATIFYNLSKKRAVFALYVHVKIFIILYEKMVILGFIYR